MEGPRQPAGVRPSLSSGIGVDCAQISVSSGDVNGVANHVGLAIAPYGMDARHFTPKVRASAAVNVSLALLVPSASCRYSGQSPAQADTSPNRTKNVSSRSTGLKIVIPFPTGGASPARAVPRSR